MWSRCNLRLRPEMARQFGVFAWPDHNGSTNYVINSLATCWVSPLWRRNDTIVISVCTCIHGTTSWLHLTEEFIQLCKRYTLQSGVALFVLFVKVGTYEVGFRRSPAPKLAAHRACRFDCLLAKPNPIQLNSHQVNSTKPKSTPNNFARTIFFSSLACAIKYVYICENIGRLSQKNNGRHANGIFFLAGNKKNQPPNATYSGIT